MVGTKQMPVYAQAAATIVRLHDPYGKRADEAGLGAYIVNKAQALPQ